MNAPTPEVGVALTEAERDELWQGLRRARHEEAPIPLASDGNRTHVLWALTPAVERIVADRLAQAQAPTDAREPLAEAWDKGYREGAIAGAGLESLPNPHDAGRCDLCGTSLPRSAHRSPEQP